MSTVLHGSLIEYEEGKSQPQCTLCKYCTALFSQPNSLPLLVSPNGLEQRRKRSCMVETALDGCNLCREMLCIPWESKYKKPGFKQPVLVRQSNCPHDWPLSLWESMKRNQETRPRLMQILTGYFEQTLLFNWKPVGSLGDVTLCQYQRFRRTRSLHIQMSIEFGRSNSKHSGE